ncbi:hypothetical protein HRI_000286100 [Hibiscus trionum]|uniref:Uncharacterized protein n=1 Tax=Hibiscus trionum TaxID=183268 RepID=A0A9W7LIL0_HIBTR|nr:hypothetical protein HRI_000286100 [Hibiscus trionum]
MNMTWCLMLEKSLPKILWAEAVNTTIYLHNTLSAKVLKAKTLYEACFRFQPLRQSEFEVVAEDEFDEDKPVRGTGSLSNIYERCNLVVLEPNDQDTDSDEWMKALEMSMIKKSFSNNLKSFVIKGSEQKVNQLKINDTILVHCNSEDQVADIFYKAFIKYRVRMVEADIEVDNKATKEEC